MCVGKPSNGIDITSTIYAIHCGGSTNEEYSTHQSNGGLNMANDRDPTQSETIVDLAKGESRLLTADFSPLLNTSETLSSITSQPTQTAGTTTLTVASGAINSGGAVAVDRKSKAVSTVCQFRVTVPSNATAGEDYVIELTCTSSASNVLKIKCLLRIW